MEEEKNLKSIDLRRIFRRLLDERKAFYRVASITFAVSAMLILCVPRYYTCSITLAPEAQSGNNMGNVATLASSFGINFGSMTSEDAIYIDIYPDVVGSQDFLISLCDEHVQTLDSAYSGTVFDYYKDYYRDPWWSRVMGWTKRMIISIFVTEPSQGKGHIDPYRLSKREFSVIKRMHKNIQCTIDASTNVITLTAKAQDAQVSAQIADYVRIHLQEFITEYRTGKAQKDIDYYSALAEQARVDYENAKSLYAAYADSHTDANRQSYVIEEQNLRSEMELRYTTYEGFVRQKMLSQAKYQERTPIYTVISQASIPVKPTGPRRVMFVLAMCILACFATSVWLIREDLLALL